MTGGEKTIIVTGGTSGLGYHATMSLARQFPDTTIMIASRKDTQAAAASISQITGHSDVHFLPLDLGNIQSIRSFVEALRERRAPPISILILNAAMQFPEGIKYTIDGIEATFGINHVGHALLFHLLWPLLAEEARVVITVSASHDPAQKTGVPYAKYISAGALAHPSGDAVNNSGMQRYATSKLCNVLWMYALNRRLNLISRKLTVVAFDPGMMPGTGLAREAGPLFRFIWHSILPRLIPLLRQIFPFSVHTVQESGKNLAWVATQKSSSGVYVEARNQIRSSTASYDETKQEDLWQWTKKFVAASVKELEDFELI